MSKKKCPRDGTKEEHSPFSTCSKCWGVNSEIIKPKYFLLTFHVFVKGRAGYANMLDKVSPGKECKIGKVAAGLCQSVGGEAATFINMIEVSEVQARDWAKYLGFDFDKLGKPG